MCHLSRAAHLAAMRERLESPKGDLHLTQVSARRSSLVPRDLGVDAGAGRIASNPLFCPSMSSIAGVSIREMGLADIPAGLGLCRASHWNQTERDWLYFLMTAHDGSPRRTASLVFFSIEGRRRPGWPKPRDSTS
jgi:hypothetical protein